MSSWWSLLVSDVHCVLQRDPAARNLLEAWTIYPGVHAIAHHRIAHALWTRGWRYLPRWISFVSRCVTQVDIHPGARIGARFFIDHGNGVVIGATAEIGEDVTLYHGVTLGARSFAKDEAGHLVKGGKRHPNVEDNVTIYPNSTILGGETVIGANSTIGANVFLMHSVPPDSLVVYEEKQLTIRTKADRKKETALDWSI